MQYFIKKILIPNNALFMHNFYLLIALLHAACSKGQEKQIEMHIRRFSAILYYVGKY
jgi:hypothetical protein